MAILNIQRAGWRLICHERFGAPQVPGICSSCSFKVIGSLFVRTTRPFVVWTRPFLPS